MAIGTLTLTEALNRLALLDPNTMTTADLEALVNQVSVQDRVTGPNATMSI